MKDPEELHKKQLLEADIKHSKAKSKEKPKEKKKGKKK